MARRTSILIEQGGYQLFFENAIHQQTLGDRQRRIHFQSVDIQTLGHVDAW
jgi:hypothetical protein